MTTAELALSSVLPSLATAPAGLANAAGAASTSAASATSAANASNDDDGNLTFGDLIDIVNPLQHIPVVSTLYRAITGDHIKTFPKIAGDTLYGGWMGFAGSLADTIFEKETGKSFGDTALSLVEDAFSPSKPDTGVADASTPADQVKIADSAPLTAVQVASLPPIDTTATSVASSAPALAAPASVDPASLDTIMIPGRESFLAALTNNGAPDTALRAVAAYRHMASTNGAAANPPMLRASIDG